MTIEALVSGRPVHRPDVWFDARVVSVDPLVTFSSSTQDFFGIAEHHAYFGELFETRKAVHFISPTWFVDRKLATAMANGIAKLEKVLPGHRFVVLSGDLLQQYHLTQQGIPAIAAGSPIFLDERMFRVREPQVPGLGMFDAVYNARLMWYKRHHLACATASLLLIHGNNFGPEAAEQARQVRQAVSHAVSANDLLYPGIKTEIPLADIAALLAHARCGLALSGVEGTMKVSAEYLLCGLPVVSTPSDGGRARYYCFPFTKIVDADPGAVSDAVAQMAGQRMDRNAIRMEFARLLAFDRHNFLIGVNDCIRAMVGPAKLFSGFSPFIGFKQRFLSTKTVLERIGQDIAKLEQAR
jgi:glycosyltransferase involved in cell wall biosynthesis